MIDSRRPLALGFGPKSHADGATQSLRQQTAAGVARHSRNRKSSSSLRTVRRHGGRRPADGRGGECDRVPFLHVLIVRLIGDLGIEIHRQGGGVRSRRPKGVGEDGAIFGSIRQDDRRERQSSGRGPGDVECRGLFTQESGLQAGEAHKESADTLVDQ